MIVISNGFSKFHLAIAASEMARRDRLTAMLTGAYPTPFVRQVVKRLGGHAKLARLLARAEQVPDALVHPLWMGEVMDGVARRFHGSPLNGLAGKLEVAAHRRYSKAAATALRRHGAGARIYHYRAGFGGPSVATARAMGMIPVCDHTIAHPALVGYLVENAGAMPPADVSPPLDGFWTQVMDDIRLGDHIVVNSDFVKDTFVNRGWDPDKITVIYLGVDDAFLDGLPPRDVDDATDGPLRLLFAGHLSARKGGPDVVAAFNMLDDVDWRLEIAGNIEPAVLAADPAFFEDPRVVRLGSLSRAELAKVMARNEVFVFPSLAEGSARVVFEALAAGCYAIVTPNAGSVVQDGVHGALVPPGRPDAIVDAVRAAAADRPRTAQIGAANAAAVRDHHRQRHYGDGLVALYDRLLGKRGASGVAKPTG